jgi:large subunit ribosomal protein L4e
MIMTKLYSIDGTSKKEIALPKLFKTEYRPDVIKRAVLSVQTEKRQPYGSDPLAGKRTSAHYHGRRRKRFTMMGRGIARMARIHGKVGSLAMRPRFVPQAVKGRRTHPPKAEKVWFKAMNNKEMLFAIKSSLAATTMPELVKERGHIFDSEVPVVVESSFENLKKTKEIIDFLMKIGLEKEMKRTKEKKEKAGKAKMRGRRTKQKKSLLVIVSKECSASKALKNIPGVDVAEAARLDAEMLAPGAKAGRLLLITEPSLDILDKNY